MHLDLLLFGNSYNPDWSSISRTNLSRKPKWSLPWLTFARFILLYWITASYKEWPNLFSISPRDLKILPSVCRHLRFVRWVRLHSWCHYLWGFRSLELWMVIYWALLGTFPEAVHFLNGRQNVLIHSNYSIPPQLGNDSVAIPLEVAKSLVQSNDEEVVRFWDKIMCTE